MAATPLPTASWNTVLTPTAILQLYKYVKHTCRNMYGVADLYPNSPILLDVVGYEIVQLSALGYEPDTVALHTLQIDVAQHLQRLATDDVDDDLTVTTATLSHAPRGPTLFNTQGGHGDIVSRRQAAEQLEQHLALQTQLEAIYVQRQRGA